MGTADHYVAQKQQHRHDQLVLMVPLVTGHAGTQSKTTLRFSVLLVSAPQVSRLLTVLSQPSAGELVVVVVPGEEALVA